jgi:hypothetical protein
MKKLFAVAIGLAVSSFANQAFAVGNPPTEKLPELGSTLILLSLGLFGLATFARNRKQR